MPSPLPSLTLHLLGLPRTGKSSLSRLILPHLSPNYTVHTNESHGTKTPTYTINSHETAIYLENAPNWQNYPILLLGTHCDMTNEDARVPLEHVEAFAAEHALFYLEVSCVEGTNVPLAQSIMGIRMDAYVERVALERHEEALAYEERMRLEEEQNDFAQSSAETLTDDLDEEEDIDYGSSPHSPVFSLHHSATRDIDELASQHTLSTSPPPSSFSKHKPNNVTIQMSPDGNYNATKVVRVNSPGATSHSQTPPHSPPLLSPLSEFTQSYLDDDLSSSSSSDIASQQSYSKHLFSKSGNIMLSPAERKFKQDLQRHSHYLSALHSEQSENEETMSEYIKNYHETKDGFVIPVISTNLKSSKASNVIYQRRVSEYKAETEKIYIDVQIGDGRVAQIAIQDGDNIFELARKLQTAYKLHSTQTINQLAYILKQAITKYVQRKKRKKEVHSRLGKKRFELETEKRASQLRSQPALLKMEFDLGNNRTGTIVVRKGASPTVLARNFVNMYGLRKSMVDAIASKIEEQLYEHYSTEAKNLIQQIVLPEDKTPAERSGAVKSPLQRSPSSSSPLVTAGGHVTKRVSPQKAAKVLFNMEVEIAKDRHEKFPVHAGETPQVLARQFATKHELSAQSEKTLLRLIKHHLKDYEDRKRKEQYSRG